MLQIRKSRELRARLGQWRQQGQRIAFVPTMGNLHDGHLSLVNIGKEQADRLVSSIFVNPMQFGPSEDFDSYPRTIEQDCKALMEAGCDLVYLPEVKDLYPRDLAYMTRVEVPDISRRLEGEFRPGHMTGVATIVLKLFNLVQPDMAVFGKKDYQQWRLIEKMVSDLNLPIDIIGGETRRESSSLAMSSRNQYLSPEQRDQALALYSELTEAGSPISGGRDADTVLTAAIDNLTRAGFAVDYFELCNRQTLEPARHGDPLVLLAAARIGGTRLIDNLEI